MPNIDQALLAVHFHNDLGMATANAMACIAEGVNIVQGTVNGLGERAGNTPLEEVIMALTRAPGRISGEVQGQAERALSSLSRLVARLTGVEPAVNKAVIGTKYFSHRGGRASGRRAQRPRRFICRSCPSRSARRLQLVLGKHSGGGPLPIARRKSALRWTISRRPRARTSQALAAAVRSYESKSEVLALLDEVFPDGHIDRSEPEDAPEEWACAGHGWSQAAMSGIAGIIGRRPVPVDLVRKMSLAEAHRGGDESIIELPHAVMAMRSHSAVAGATLRTALRGTELRP